MVAALDGGDVEAAHAIVGDDMVDDFVLLGDPEQCAVRIASYLELGVDRAILFPLPPDGDWASAVTAAIDVAPTLGAHVRARRTLAV